MQPVVFRSFQHHGIKALGVVLRFVEIDVDEPAWIVQRFKLDTIAVLPISVALLNKPILQLWKTTHPYQPPRFAEILTATAPYNEGVISTGPTRILFSSGSTPRETISFRSASGNANSPRSSKMSRCSIVA